MKVKVKLMMAVGILIGTVLHAQEKTPLGLKEAIDLSIKNSKQLKISSAKIEEATAVLKEAVQRKLPDANVTGSYLRLNSANVDLKKQNTNGGSGSPEISQALYGLVNASLPIYSGGKIRYGIESSKFLEQAAKLDAENEKEEVIANTVDAYVNLFKAKT